MLKKIIFAILVVLVLGACTPYQTTDQGKAITSKIDPNLYFLEIKIDDDVLSHSTIQGSLSGSVIGGYGSMGGRIWQEGKGLLRGELLSVNPTVPFADVGQQIIVKTTDLKIMSLRHGEVVRLGCTSDYEPICALTEDGEIGECYELWEFDYCRMIDFNTVMD